MNVKKLTIDQLYQKRDATLAEATGYVEESKVELEYMLKFSKRFYQSLGGALGTLGTYAGVKYLTPSMDEMDKISLRAHYRPVCEKEAKTTLAGEFNTQRPTTQQTEMVDTCVEGYVSIHTANQPSVDVIGIGVTLAFLVAAGLQKWKASLCFDKFQDLRELAYTANQESDQYSYELERRRRRTDLKLVSNSSWRAEL